MIHINRLTKSLGGRLISDALNLHIPTGESTCIIGRSGEGKSVLLKQIIGLIQPDAGSIVIDGIDITTCSSAAREKVLHACGYVFQFAALLDSLTIYENVALPLIEQGLKPQKIASLVVEKLALVNLHENTFHKYPAELSGGMRKRVGIARTLILEPYIILYDEPTTGLDPITARVVHELMRETQKKLNATSIIVSHDIEIFNYVDNVALLYQGKIRYFGKATTVWESNNPYVYQCIRGLTNGPMQPDV